MSLKYEPASEPLHISPSHARFWWVWRHTLDLSHTQLRRSERGFFIDNLLVRIHFIIVMTRWTGLAPWEFEFPFPGSLTSTFLGRRSPLMRGFGGSGAVHTVLPWEAFGDYGAPPGGSIHLAWPALEVAHSGDKSPVGKAGVTLHNHVHQ